jgi:drug/metabolite transporter (DMT)-like permease
LIGALVFSKKVAAQKVAGVLVGFVGLVLLSVSRGPVTLNELGFTLLILLATVFYGLNVNLVMAYLQGINPIHIAAVSLASLLLPSLAVLYFHPVSFEQPAVRQSVFACIGLGVLSSAIATALYYALIKKAGGLFASLVTYAIPVVAIFWGMLSGEQIGALQFGCLGIILGGVYLANR